MQLKHLAPYIRAVRADGCQVLWLSDRVVSCPARMCLPARNGLVNEVEFLLGLLPKTGNDQ